MTDEERICGAYYEPDQIWTCGKAIKELRKIASMPKKSYQTMVSQASPMASSYTTPKGNTPS